MFEGDPVVDDMHGWYPVDDLPEPMVDSHITDIIPIALAAYKARNNL